MKKIVLTVLTTVYLQCGAQNLVNNPSLEEYSICPNNFNQISLANYWSAGCEYGNHDEYFNCCTLDDPNIDPYLVLFWSHALTVIKPHSGFGEAGLILYYTNLDAGILNYREVISGKFKNILIPNRCYNVSFYIRFLGYHTNWYINNKNILNYATNRVSALISADSIIYPTVGYTDLFQFHPQINYYGSVLNDTTSWVKIEGDFIAQGNEQWIHVSSFIPDDSITVYILPNLLNQVDSSDMPSYYLIDDVSVYPCDAPVYFADAGNDTCIKPSGSVTLGLPNRDEYLYWWINGNTGDTISRQSQIVVFPQVTTTYILVQKDFKFDETRDSVTVTVGSCIGSPDYRGVDFEIFPNPNNGNFQVRFNTSIPDGAILQLHDMLGRVIGEYKLEGLENTANLHIEVAQAIYCATVIIPNVFKKSVKIVILK